MKGIINKALVVTLLISTVPAFGMFRAAARFINPSCPMVRTFATNAKTPKVQATRKVRSDKGVPRAPKVQAPVEAPKVQAATPEAKQTVSRYQILRDILGTGYADIASKCGAGCKVVHSTVQNGYNSAAMGVRSAVEVVKTSSAKATGATRSAFERVQAQVSPKVQATVNGVRTAVEVVKASPEAKLAQDGAGLAAKRAGQAYESVKTRPWHWFAGLSPVAVLVGYKLSPSPEKKSKTKKA